MTMLRTVAFLSLWGFPALVFALDTSLDVGAAAYHTDNSNLAATNEQSDVETIVKADASLQHTGPAIEADANYNVRRIEFDKETQRDKTLTTGDGTLQWNQVPGTLVWKLTNRVREVLTDKSLANTQNNRDGRSITTASGRYTARPGQGNTLSFNGNYSETRYDDTSGQDSDRAGAGISFGRALTPVSTASLSLSYSDVTFDTASRDYEYYNATLNYGARLARLSYNLELGYNEQKVANGRKVDGTFVNIRANYSDGGSNWSLDLQQRLTDSSIGNFNQSTSGLNTSANTASGNVYERTAAEVIYSNNAICRSCNWNIRGLYEQDRYESGVGDTDEAAIKTSLNYQLTQAVNVAGSVEYREVEFLDSLSGLDYDLTTYDLSWRVALAKRLSMTASVSYEERSTTDGFADYEELRGGIALNYRIK